MVVWHYLSKFLKDAFKHEVFKHSKKDRTASKQIVFPYKSMEVKMVLFYPSQKNVGIEQNII